MKISPKMEEVLARTREVLDETFPGGVLSRDEYLADLERRKREAALRPAAAIPVEVEERNEHDVREDDRAAEFERRKNYDGERGVDHRPRSADSERSRSAYEEQERRHAEAAAFLRELPEGETFEFLVSVKAKLKRYGELTPGQVNAVLKCRDARVRKNEERSSSTRSLESVPAGYYAVEDSKGKLRFLHVETSDKPGKWNGTTFIGEQYGGRSDLERRGYISPDGTARYVSDDTAAMLDEIRKAPLEASTRYGRELGVCGVCSRPLTDEESRRNGIGPVCAKKF